MEKHLEIIMFFIFILIILIITYSLRQNVDIKISKTSQIDKNIKIITDSTIIGKLREISKKYPNHDALKIKNNNKWTSVSYLEYYKNVVSFSQSLNNWLGKNINVAIIGFNSPGWYYSHLGSMANGGFSVAIHPTEKIEKCKEIFINANIELLVVEDDRQLKKFMDIDIKPIKLIVYYAPITDNVVENFNVPVLSMGNFVAKEKKYKSKKYPKLNDTAIVMYNKNKYIKLSHENIMSTCDNLIYMTKKSNIILEKENILSYLPLTYAITQIMDIYMPIFTSSTVWLADENILQNTFNEKSMKKYLLDVRPTIFFGVPKIWENIMNLMVKDTNKFGLKESLSKTFSPKMLLNDIGLDRCKLAFTGTDILSNKTRNYFDVIHLPLYDIYGSNETSGLISLSLPGQIKNNSVGVPVMNVKIRDNKIIVKGNNLFSGYIDDNKQNIKSFETNDIGSFEKGLLYVEGNNKDVLIMANNTKIIPSLLENKIKDKITHNINYAILVTDTERKNIGVLLNITDETSHDSINKLMKNILLEIHPTNSKNIYKFEKWKILPNNFEVGKELSPLFKLRRSYIIKKYKNKIKSMFSS
jgi:long-subunit acyl-CoA synthetase (AMP-forming)